MCTHKYLCPEVVSSAEGAKEFKLLAPNSKQGGSSGKRGIEVGAFQTTVSGLESDTVRPSNQGMPSPLQDSFKPELGVATAECHGHLRPDSKSGQPPLCPQHSSGMPVTVGTRRLPAPPIHPKMLKLCPIGISGGILKSASDPPRQCPATLSQAAAEFSKEAAMLANGVPQKATGAVGASGLGTHGCRNQGSGPPPPTTLPLQMTGR